MHANCHYSEILCKMILFLSKEQFKYYVMFFGPFFTPTPLCNEYADTRPPPLEYYVTPASTPPPSKSINRFLLFKNKVIILDLYPKIMVFRIFLIIMFKMVLMFSLALTSRIGKS